MNRCELSSALIKISTPDIEISMSGYAIKLVSFFSHIPNC